MRYMKALVGGLVAVLALGAQAAFAHTHLKSSTPADGSTVKAVPTHITLTFEDHVQVTAASITGKGGKPQTIIGLPEGVVKEATLKLPALAPGEYVVNYRAAGHDGHVMSGQVKFKVEPVDAK